MDSVTVNVTVNIAFRKTINAKILTVADQDFFDIST